MVTDFTIGSRQTKGNRVTGRSGDREKFKGGSIRNVIKVTGANRRDAAKSSMNRTLRFQTSQEWLKSLL
jgi:hypothetical protein